jgi:hypothetical protein
VGGEPAGERAAGQPGGAQVLGGTLPVLLRRPAKGWPSQRRVGVSRDDRGQCDAQSGEQQDPCVCRRWAASG